jgi:hypothetical protein
MVAGAGFVPGPASIPSAPVEEGDEAMEEPRTQARMVHEMTAFLCLTVVA